VRLQHQPLRIRIVGTTGGDRLPSRRAKRDAERLRHVLSDVRLDIDRVTRLAVIALRPAFHAAFAIDQLRRDPDCRGRLPDAAGQDVGDAQLP